MHIGTVGSDQTFIPRLRFDYLVYLDVTRNMSCFTISLLSVPRNSTFNTCLINISISFI